MECRNVLVNDRIVSKEIIDVKVNLLSASPFISQIIRSLFMVNKLIY